MTYERSKVAVVHVRTLDNEATISPGQAVSPSTLAHASALDHTLTQELRCGISHTISSIACISTTRGEVVGLIKTGQAACLGTRSLGVTVEGFDSGVK